jgi:hypothetical protein
MSDSISLRQRALRLSYRQSSVDGTLGVDAAEDRTLRTRLQS